MTLKTVLGSSSNILDTSNNTVKFIRLESPVLDKHSYNKLKHISIAGYKGVTIDCSFNKDHKSGDLEAKLTEIGKQAEKAIQDGVNLIYLDNITTVTEQSAPVPSLLSTGAVHHYLVNQGLRQKASIIVKGGDILETHHFATLLGYGADAIYPELSYESIEAIYNRGKLDSEYDINKYKNIYIKAVNKGLLKIMSKLGISTVASYRGAQAFEALGISSEVVAKCFEGTVSRIEGMTFDMLAKEVLTKHRVAFENELQNELIDLGVYQWKRRGEFHLFNPASVHLLQHSTKTGDFGIYKKLSLIHI